MSISIDRSFIKQFEADVHLAFQQMGTKLRATVRTKSDVKGSSTTFQRISKGIAATKSRHGLVPVMNLEHEPVECVLNDYYAGDWVDELDELKTNIDERRVVASAAAMIGNMEREADLDIANSRSLYALNSALDNAKYNYKKNKNLLDSVSSGLGAVKSFI